MRRNVYLDNTIEFLRGRVYLGAYDYTPEDTEEMVFFTVEDSIFYNSFHLDFGPMNIGHLYRFAVIFHEILNDPDNASRAVVFYSSTSTRQRANSACMLCCYMILVQGWTPHQVLQPLAQVDPPFMPFRDAGYSNADFEITIQDVVYGVWRAKERGLIDLHSFNLETYERYEHVENGDLNVLTPDFIAFASPQEDSRLLNSNTVTSKSHLNQPFRSVLKFFSNNQVQLVVRLNSHLYNKKHFEDAGIQHLDMIFEDGTCPDMSIVQNFIGAAETVIKGGGKIAVHCKAGLGRTGCLIGAHLIYTHGFTANECIGFLRFMRPGMVVGPQQHWIYLHQNDFREWKYTMRLSLVPNDLIGNLYPLVSLDKYRAQKKRLKDEKRHRMYREVDESELRDLAMTPPSPKKTGRAGATNFEAAAKKLKDEKRHRMYREVDESELRDLAMTPPSPKKTGRAGATNFEAAAVPQNSPGQPRKGQNGSNTIEEITKAKGKRLDARHARVIADNNSDDDMMQQDDTGSAGSKMLNEMEKSVQYEGGDDDALLRQLLPKNKRINSGRRTASATGGIRKVSGTSKKL
ncbi:probable Tyrosine-protein phosphatase CDC14 [Zygosaccharomyces bailii ISA1307]|nr:probable Tyrosine-protein phosphatase CDC14 [Zygosaccharomyces bailii ISA1307]